MTTIYEYDEMKFDFILQKRPYMYVDFQATLKACTMYAVIYWFMCGSEGDQGVGTPPGKSQKYRVS